MQSATLSETLGGTQNNQLKKIKIMTTKEINASLVGKRVSGIFTALEFTGTVLSIVEDEYMIGLEIKFDEPINWGGHYYKTYQSVGRKIDDWGNLQHTQLI